MQLADKEIARLCRALAQLQHAGISLSDGVHLLRQQENGSLNALLSLLGEKMDTGVQLSQAMEDAQVFPPLVIGMIRIGENTGRLEESLQSLGEYYDERCRTARQIRGALTYPSLMMLLMLAVIAVLLVQVLPVFDQVYSSLGTRLTGAAAGLLYLGQVLKGLMPVLLAVLLVIAGAACAYRFLPALRQRINEAVHRRFGDWGPMGKFNNARFARGLSMGLSSGLTLEEAVALACQLLADVPGAAARGEACAAALAAGDSLSDALSKGGLLLPTQAQMLNLGLLGGNADQIMTEIAGDLMTEARQSLEDAVSRIEPAMVLASSLLVGLILLSVMLPLMDIMSTIG